MLWSHGPQWERRPELPDAVILAMLRRELLLTTAKLHVL